MDRDNLFAVGWGVLYCVALVLVVAAGHALSIEPTWTVPIVVVALPFAVGWSLRVVERATAGRHDG